MRGSLEVECFSDLGSSSLLAARIDGRSRLAALVLKPPSPNAMSTDETTDALVNY